MKKLIIRPLNVQNAEVLHTQNVFWILLVAQRSNFFFASIDHIIERKQVSLFFERPLKKKK